MRDVTFRIQPWLVFLRTELRNGRLPLWNPHQGAGTSFFGNGESAPLFPIHLVFALLPLQLGFIFIPWARVVVAGLGAFRLAREFGMSTTAASAVAAIYPLSGMCVAFLLYPMGNALALVPWIWWATERVATNRGGAGALAASVAAQGLAGHPETWVHTATLVSLYLLIRGSGTTRPRRLWTTYAGAWLLGAALAAVQWLPIAHVILESSRWRSPGRGYSPSLAEITRLVLPRGLGSVADGTWLGTWNELGTASYVGLLALALAFLGLTRWRTDRRIAAIGAITILCFWLAYDLPGLRALLTQVPIVGRALHHRLIFGVELGLALLAGWGVDHWIAGRHRAIRSAALACGLAMAAAALLWRSWAGHGLTGQQVRFTLLALAPVLLWIAALRIHRRPWVPPMLVGLLAIDLLFAHADVNPALPIEAFYPRTGAVDFLAAHGGRFAATGTALRPNAATVYGLFDVRLDDSIKSNRYAELYAKNLGSPHPTEFRPIRHWRSRWLDRLGVRWVVTGSGARPPVRGWRLAYDGADARIYRRRSSAPMVHWEDDGTGGGVAVREQHPGYWRVETETNGPRTLEVAELCDSGWRAAVDGRKALLNCVEASLLAVTVPSGSHEVRLAYRSPGIAVGLAVSALALLACLVAFGRRPTVDSA